jgi:hypothetical protein
MGAVSGFVVIGPGLCAEAASANETMTIAIKLRMNPPVLARAENRS